tara:strand:- start:2348 stop:2569 length:222 start_codon:yes stop_codon:yes gene_type:complete
MPKKSENTNEALKRHLIDRWGSISEAAYQNGMSESSMYKIVREEIMYVKKIKSFIEKNDCPINILIRVPKKNE